MPKPSPRFSPAKKRLIRLAATLVVTGLCTAYLVWKIDLSQTLHLLAHAHFGYFFGAVAIMVLSVWPMAWRWEKLLHVRGIHERLSWLVRAYFVAYTAGQILPTAVGGDAVRIYETARRHPGQGAPVASSVLLERALGGTATTTLAPTSGSRARSSLRPWCWPLRSSRAGCVLCLPGRFPCSA
jgi:uncharacterized membrane protein YbhN (UPF0104 family)